MLGLPLPVAPAQYNNKNISKYCRMQLLPFISICQWSCFAFQNILFIIFNKLFFFGHPVAYGVSRPRIRCKMQLWPMPQLQQHWILNPLCQEGSNLCPSTLETLLILLLYSKLILKIIIHLSFRDWKVEKYMYIYMYILIYIIQWVLI